MEDHAGHGLIAVVGLVVDWGLGVQALLAQGELAAFVEQTLAFFGQGGSLEFEIACERFEGDALVGDAFAFGDELLLAGFELRPQAVFFLLELRFALGQGCLLYTSPSPRDGLLSRMPSSA